MLFDANLSPRAYICCLPECLPACLGGAEIESTGDVSILFGRQVETTHETRDAPRRHPSVLPYQQTAVAGPITVTTTGAAAAAPSAAVPSLPFPRSSSPPSTGESAGAIGAQQTGEERLVPPPARAGSISLQQRCVVHSRGGMC